MRIGILTAGGPAPGFNGVIAAIVTAAARRGWTVVGIPRGFTPLIHNDTKACRALTAADVADIATRGGSILGTARANPTRSKGDLDAVVASVRKLKLDALVTIGGDDTASAAAAVGEALGDLRVAHVPKTIDNDLPLPGHQPTFGFETAKALGARLCQNLRVDAITTGRWYLVSAMGRSAGHLALGIGAAAAADLITIPEEYEDGTRLDAVADLVERAIALRAEQGHAGGLVVLGEGILDHLAKQDLARIASLERDEHGNPRMSEVDFGRAVRDVLVARGATAKFVTKIIGYELRCADPIAFDVQYTQTLGAAAVRFLADGKGDAVICVREDEIVTLPFSDLRGPDGRVRVRRVDLGGAAWQASLALQAR
jgi:6-phosphofructokinase 1